MNTQRLTLWLAALLLVGTAACASGASSRDARIVVMPISGNSSASKAVHKLVDSRYELVSSKKYKKAATKLKARSTKSKHVRKVSRKLDVDALVAGSFVKKGKRKYDLRLSLLAGDSGEEFETLTIKLKSKKLSKRDHGKIKKRLYTALSEVEGWTQDVSDSSASSERGKRSNRGGNSDRERERARKLRDKEHEKEMRSEDRRAAKRDERDERDEERRSEKEKKRERKLAKKERKMRRDRDEDEDEDEDRSRSKKKKKKRDRDDDYEVVTKRDTATGQALDDESPF